MVSSTLMHCLHNICNTRLMNYMNFELYDWSFNHTKTWIQLSSLQDLPYFTPLEAVIVKIILFALPLPDKESRTLAGGGGPHPLGQFSDKLCSTFWHCTPASIKGAFGKKIQQISSFYKRAILSNCEVCTAVVFHFSFVKNDVKVLLVLFDIFQNLWKSTYSSSEMPLGVLVKINKCIEFCDN